MDGTVRKLAVPLMALTALFALGIAVWWIVRPASAPAISADVTQYLNTAQEGFERVSAPRPLVFPADEGAHPGYQTEWWYYTGNLASTAGQGTQGERSADPGSRATPGRRFGFQLTFFRSALSPDPDPRRSAWGTGQAYLGHFTVTDVAADTFHSAERLARGGAGLAGTTVDPLATWVETWSAAEFGAPIGADASLAGHGETTAAASDVAPDVAAATRRTRPPMRLRAADGPVAIDLVIRPAKPAALHGRDGYSVKGPQPGNASYYYSWSRLEATGIVTTADGTFPVDGFAWMDHEWSTSALAEDQVGWDWFSLQLSDGTELMAFEIREEDGGVAPESSGSLIDREGAVTPLEAADLEIEVLDTWTSPRTGGVYPSGWRLRAPRFDVDLEVRPLVHDQELSVTFRYWEGAVRITGTSDGRPVDGFGYVELTGYAPTEGQIPGLGPAGR